jgi:hypothetical protein
MHYIMTVVFLATTIVITQVKTASAAAKDTTGGPTIFLCVDSMMQIKKATGRVPPKIVYGYIDGIKTECMSEQDFRLRYCTSNEERATVAQVDSQKLLEERGLRRTLPRLNPVESALKGRKDLSGVDLKGTDLKGVNLERADLRKANLSYADLRGANLRGAKLNGAILECAYLKDANLAGADLEGANLKGAYLHFANLNEANGLNVENLRFTRTLYNADMDTLLLDAVKEYCPNKLADPGWHWDTGKMTDPDAPAVKKADPKRFH